MAAVISPSDIATFRAATASPGSLLAEVQRAELAVQRATTLRANIEQANRASDRLLDELTRGYDYARSLVADAKFQNEQLRKLAEEWRKAHPARSALSDVFGEPAALRDYREREERKRQELQEARERRADIDSRRLQAQSERETHGKRLEQAREQERAASQRVESLLRHLPPSELKALREHAREQTRPQPQPSQER